MENVSLPHKVDQATGKTIEKHTGMLVERDTVLAMTMPYQGDTNGASEYFPVPSDLAEVQTRHQLPMWAWRVEFHSVAMGAPPLGLDILGPVILGRKTPQDSSVNVDFTPYDAMERGVSRQHALIRPTQDRLYLIDLSSTNGTRRNEVELGAGIAVTLEDRDTISLGGLTFEIRIIERPDPAAIQLNPEAKINDTQPMRRDQHG